MSMRKKDDIMEIYKKRMDEFICMPPEDGWDKLEKELALSSTHWFLPYRRVAVAAAVLLCVGLLVPFLIPKEDSGGLSYLSEEIKEEPAGQAQLQVASVEDFLSSSRQTAMVSPATIAKKELSVILPQQKEKDEEDIQAATTAKQKEEETAIPSEKEKSDKITRGKTGPELSTQPFKAEEYSTKRKRQQQGKKWSVDLIVGSNALASGGSADDYVFRPPPLGEDYESDGKDEEEKEKEVETKSSVPLRKEVREDFTYSHRLPLTASIRLSRYLSDRLAVETGLSFTYLSADIKRHSTKRGEQAVHYLGVPVKANWTFYQNGRFHAYLSGGAMLEYCLSAQQKVDGQKYSLDINRWQWSLHAAGGIQLDIVRPLSLFVEPGLSYYFEQNKNRPFETSRMERPLSFSLQLGVRFSY